LLLLLLRQVRYALLLLLLPQVPRVTTIIHNHKLRLCVSADRCS
jgi:hypothetical protein